MADLNLLAYLEGFISAERSERFREVLAQRTNFLTVAMEDVYQLHNASAVIRSCEVFGIQQIHLIESKYGRRLDKRIAMGAQQWVDMHHYTNAETCMENLRHRGYSLVATTPHAEAISLEEFKIEKPTALFFGTEKDGLSPAIMEAADAFLKIPMVGFTESLNISVAAAIIIRHVSSELRKSGLPWQLTGEEILEKRLDWAKKSIKSHKAILQRYYRGKVT